MESPSAEPNQPPSAPPLLEQAPALDRSRRPASRASVAQRQLPFPGPAALDMAAAPICLRVLLAEQRLRNLTGNAALSPAEVADYAKAGFKPGTPISPFSEAAWRPGAETNLHERVESICHELVAGHLCHESQRETSLYVASRHFTGDALKTFKQAVRVTRDLQGADQTGIGNGSLVYRCFIRMLQDYQTKQGKRLIEARLKGLTWDRAGVSATRAAWTAALQEAQEVATRTGAQAPALRFMFPDFTTILAWLRSIWPAWAEHECVRDPDQFLTLQATWDTLSKFEPARGGGGNVHAVCRPCVDPPAVEIIDGHVERASDWRVEAALEAAQEGDLVTARLLLQDDLPRLLTLPAEGGVIHQGHILALSQMARNGRPITCFRCGCTAHPHRVAECRAQPSAEELQGLHRSLWPRVAPVMPGQAMAPPPPAAMQPARVGLPVHQLQGGAEAQIAALVRGNEELRQEFKAFQAQYFQSVAGPAPAAVMQLAVPPVAIEAAVLFCAPRGTQPPPDSLVVAQDATFDWFAQTSASEASIDAALTRWPTAPALGNGRG